MDDIKPIELHIELPNHWAIAGESIWALNLGGDVFELKNVPCYAYDLNMGDRVLALIQPPDLILRVQKVVAKSGHRTLRALLHENVDLGEWKKLTARLSDYGVTRIQVSERFFVFDIQPEGDYDSLYLRLEDLEELGILQYETCEARSEGSFDDLPQDQQGETR
ncbi:MAG: DUF4265 domain-containing protein [bacterium]|nr:DUF4265 domain-containing protein [bacterium]